MLDDTLGPALVATLGPGEWAPTISLNVHFLRPAAPGQLCGHGHGRVVRRGRDIAFLAGDLTTPAGDVVATATATQWSAGLRSKSRGAGQRAWHRLGRGGPGAGGPPGPHVLYVPLERFQRDLGALATHQVANVPRFREKATSGTLSM